MNISNLSVTPSQLEGREDGEGINRRAAIRSRLSRGRSINFNTHSLVSQFEDGFTYSSVEDLHQRFVGVIGCMPSRLQVFEVIDEWMLNIEAALAVPRHMDLDIPDNVYDELHGMLKREYETWDLIKTLYFDRLSEKDEELKPFDEPIFDEYHLDEKTYLETIINGDKSLLEMESIINWLQMNHKRLDDPDVTQRKIAWEQTLEGLKRDKLLGKQGTGSIVTSIDPDAPTRQKKQLKPLDAEEELRIQRATYHYLRNGEMEKGIAYLHESGHIAKAAALMGAESSWTETVDIDMESMESIVPTRSVATSSEYPTESGLQPRPKPTFIVNGNTKRDLWKSIAWKICEKKGSSKWERAVFGICCGHLPAILNVAQTWEDKLWACLKVSADVNAEDKLRKLNVANNHIPLPSEYWSQGMSLAVILERIESTEEGSFFDPSTSLQLLQKCVMLDDIGQFLATLERKIEPLLENLQHNVIYNHVIRFLTHVMLVFAIVELPYSEELTNLMSEAFVRILVKEQRFTMIPFYVQKLSSELQIPVIISQISVDEIYGKKDIIEFLQTASANELDVLSIGVAVVEKFNDEALNFDVDALQWIECCYNLVQQHHLVMLELLKYAVLITRKHMMLGDLEKCNKLISKITPDCISEVQSISPLFQETLIRECICYREYLDAEEALGKWKVAKSQKPIFNVADNSKNIQQSLVDRAQFEKSKRDFEVVERKWKKTLNFQASDAIQKFMGILKFPSGWLRNCCDKSDEEENMHIDAVRRIIIKKVTYVLLNLVKERKSAQEFKDFIYVLCEGHRKILDEFSASEIGNIFRVIEEYTRSSCSNLMKLPK